MACFMDFFFVAMMCADDPTMLEPRKLGIMKRGAVTALKSSLEDNKTLFATILSAAINVACTKGTDGRFDQIRLASTVFVSYTPATRTAMKKMLPCEG